MQHKFQNRFIFKAARIGILCHYWDVKLELLTAEATEKENAEVLGICGRMRQIPVDVKEEMMRYYLAQV